MSYGNQQFSDQNPYRSSDVYDYAQVTTAALAAESERTAFIHRTYLHLAGAVALFIAVEAAIFTLVPEATLQSVTRFLFSGWNVLLLMGGFMAVSWIADSWARSDRSTGLQYIGLGLYVLAQAAMFVPLLWYAQRIDENLIPVAGAITVISFGLLTAVVLLTKQDMSFLGKFLWWGGILSIATIGCAIVFQFSLGVWFSAAMVGLAGGYILFHTSNIVHHYRTDQHVAAALALFSSVALFFFYILRLLIGVRD